MNYQIVRNVIGKLMILLAFLMFLPLIVCIIYQEEFINYIAFLVPIVLLLIIGVLFNLKQAEHKKMMVREGFIIVGVSWLIMSLFGCLPFIISGVLTNPFDAFFEITSGFTTTGATVMGSLTTPTVEEALGMSHGIMFWRSFAHWIGGMGVLVFILMIIPESDEGSAVHILRAESPGPQVGRLVTKMKASSRILYLIYIVLTLICIIFLWAGDMNFYESVIYAFGTAGTGGFAVDSTCLELYSAYSQYVISIFMIIFGINFTLYYFILIGNIKDVFKNDELKWYLCIVVSAIILVCISIYSKCQSFSEAFRLSLFQVASFVSTTGYTTTSFIKWPTLALLVLFILMFMGSCGGSTAGGLKCSRIVILAKSTIKKIKAMINPRKVETIKMDGNSISEETISSVTSFLSVYLIILLLGALVIACDPIEGKSLVDCFSGSLSCISNVGPGLGGVTCATMGNFNNFTKFYLSLQMIAGRLELFPLLMLFSPKTWSVKRM